MQFSTINLVLDWPWALLSFSIPKLICLHCGGVHWDCETLSGLFQHCSGTVSQSLHPVHMENAQPKWNGASTAVVLNLNKTKSSHSVSQYDCFTVRPCCAIYWSRWLRLFQYNAALVTLGMAEDFHLWKVSIWWIHIHFIIILSIVHCQGTMGPNDMMI